nr:hypothetical protein [Gammaproteobacteria bacterium]
MCRRSAVGKARSSRGVLGFIGETKRADYSTARASKSVRPGETGRVPRAQTLCRREGLRSSAMTAPATDAVGDG